MHTYNADLDLLVFRPTGNMDLGMIRSYYDIISELKPAAVTRRLVDLDTLERIDFGYDDFGSISRMARQAGALGNPIRIALFATRPLAVGTANMVQRIMSRSDYLIAVARTIEEAAEHLEVPAASLEDGSTAV